MSSCTRAAGHGIAEAHEALDGAVAHLLVAAGAVGDERAGVGDGGEVVVGAGDGVVVAAVFAGEEALAPELLGRRRRSASTSSAGRPALAMARVMLQSTQWLGLGIEVSGGMPCGRAELAQDARLARPVVEQRRVEIEDDDGAGQGADPGQYAFQDRGIVGEWVTSRSDHLLPTYHNNRWALA